MVACHRELPCGTACSCCETKHLAGAVDKARTYFGAPALVFTVPATGAIVDDVPAHAVTRIALVAAD